MLKLLHFTLLIKVVKTFIHSNILIYMRITLNSNIFLVATPLENLIKFLTTQIKYSFHLTSSRCVSVFRSL